MKIDVRLSGSLFSVLIFTVLTVLIAGCSQYVAEPQPVEMPTQTTNAPKPMRAVERLIDEAEQQLADNNWQAAIATAERGLRVDRRDPSLYLLLAKSYRALDDDYRAQQFAEQGLRYVSDPEAPVGSELRGLLNLIRQ